MGAAFLFGRGLNLKLWRLVAALVRPLLTTGYL